MTRQQADRGTGDRNPDMILRAALHTDLPALAQLGRDSFIDAFGRLYKPQDLEAFLGEYRTVEAFARQLAEPATRIAVVERDGRLLGYCLLRLNDSFEERPAPRPRRPALLSQLYCGVGASGQGIGAQLMDWAMAECRAWGADAVQLSVYSENFGAQRFYRRYGFSKVADIHFWVGNHCDDEFLYECPL